MLGEGQFRRKKISEMSNIFQRTEDDEDELEPRPALPCSDDDGETVDENSVPATAEEYLRMVSKF